MLKEIIWGFDPFMTQTKIRNNCIALLNFLSSKTQASVEPVYVATPSELMLSADFRLPKTSRLRAAANLALKQSLKSVKIKKLSPAKLLFSAESFNTTTSAQILTNYAAKSACELLLVGTQSKRGLQRFFLGSFAETLLYHSKTPVVLVGAKMKSRAKVSRILFATDFSPESMKAFRKLCQLAALLRAEIMVVHVVEDTLAYANPFDGLYMGSEALLFADAIRTQKKSAERRLKSLISFGKASRVRVRGEVLESHENIGELVVKQAKKFDADMMALATQSGPVRAALGSVARSIIRRSGIPVWVFPRKA